VKLKSMQLEVLILLLIKLWNLECQIENHPDGGFILKAYVSEVFRLYS
jgi:hypothetical protein